MTSHGILLFAHGARDPAWAQPFEAATARLRQRLAPQGDTEVRLAFLEFMSPSLRDAGADLAASGCRQVTVVPLFLGAGGHVRKDLPALMETLGARHPAVTFCLEAAIGEREDVIAAMAQSIVLGSEPGPGPSAVTARTT